MVKSQTKAFIPSYTLKPKERKLAKRNSLKTV